MTEKIPMSMNMRTANMKNSEALNKINHSSAC